MIRLRTWIVLSALGVAGCSAIGDPPPVETTWSPRAQPTKGTPTARWSLTLSTSGRVAKVGDTYAVSTGGDDEDGELLGISEEGKRRWEKSLPEDASWRIADGQVVISDDGEDMQVFDPADGKERWKAKDLSDVAIFQKTVYTSECRSEEDCRLSARDLRTGKKRWTVPTGESEVPETDAVGVRGPHAPPDADHVVLVVGGPGALDGWVPPGSDSFRGAVALSAKTGARLGANAEWGAWSGLAVGPNVVVTNSDEPECGTTMWAVNARSGEKQWKKSVGAPTETGDRGECRKGLNPLWLEDGKVAVGEGSRVLTLTRKGVPQVFDLIKGETVWTTPDPGAVVDGDGSGMLVREKIDSGGFTFYDLKSRKAVWSARDAGPGFAGTAVHEDRVVLREGLKSDCHGQIAACTVRVHDRRSGKLLLTPPGDYSGSGSDWVATAVYKDGSWRLSLYPT